jgi:hypothetical protein
VFSETNRNLFSPKLTSLNNDTDNDHPTTSLHNNKIPRINQFEISQELDEEDVDILLSSRIKEHEIMS